MSSGRNDRCGKCGAKNKRCSCPSQVTSRPNYWLWVWGTVIVTIFALVVSWPAQPKSPTVMPTASSNQAAGQSSHLLNAVDQYIKEHTTPAIWWYTSATPETLPSIEKECLERKKEIITMLKQYRDLNDFAREIAGYYEDPRISVLNQGNSLQVGSQKTLTPGPEICYFGEADRDSQPASLWFNPDWPALMIPAQTIPNKVMPGLMLHEMGHGYQHSLGKPSATAPPDSDLYIGEEVLMHELESAAFNHASDGKFFTLIDDILAREGKRGWKEAMSGLTIDDLRQLDSVLDLKAANASTVNTASSQFVLQVGLRYIDRFQDGKKEEKIAAYRFITSLFMPSRS